MYKLYVYNKCVKEYKEDEEIERVIRDAKIEVLKIFTHTMKKYERDYGEDYEKNRNRTWKCNDEQMTKWFNNIKNRSITIYKNPKLFKQYNGNEEIIGYEDRYTLVNDNLNNDLKWDTSFCELKVWLRDCDILGSNYDLMVKFMDVMKRNRLRRREYIKTLKLNDKVQDQDYSEVDIELLSFDQLIS